MKLSIMLLMTTFLTLSAQANEYQNWMGSAAKLDCKSTFEHNEREIVSTIKTNMTGEGDDERVRSLDIYSQVQIGTDEYRRKYVINSVNVDVLDENESAENVQLRPTIVEGRHPKTGAKIKIEIEQDEVSGSMDYNPATIYINGKTQDYLKLECRVIFAG